MTTIGIVLFDGAEELDFVGPWEVFTASAMLHREAGHEPGRVRLIAQATGPVSCAKGRRLATHWASEDRLAQLGVEVVRDQRWVQDGKMVTSQGVSAGIDMALWLVGRLHTPEHARATQRYIQYGPAPPYTEH